MNDCTFVVFTVTHVSIFARVPEISSPKVSTNGGNTGRLLHPVPLNPFYAPCDHRSPLYLPLNTLYGTMQSIGDTPWKPDIYKEHSHYMTDVKHLHEIR